MLGRFHLVLSGSGARFASFIGAYEELIKVYPNFDQNLDTVIGTSGGALVGAMICLGYSLSSIKELCLTIEYNDLKEPDINGFLVKYGLDAGRSFSKLFKVVVKKKLGNAEATLGDLYEKRRRSLIITGTNITTMQSVAFDPHTHPTMPIWLALRISISIPFLFASVTYNGHEYVDGGVLNQFPISLLPCIDRQDVVIGINLEFSKQQNEIHDIVSFIKALTKTMFNSINSRDFDALQDQHVIIRIITENLSAFDLDVSRDVRNRLVIEAARQAHEYLWSDRCVVRRLVKSIFDKLLLIS